MNQSDYDRLAELIKTQQAQADEQGKLAQVAARMGGQTDFSPLMALADSWSGNTNLSRGYERPMAADARIEDLARLRKAATSAQDSVNDSLISRMNAKDRMDSTRAYRQVASEETRERKLGDAALQWARLTEKDMSKLKEKKLAFQQLGSLSDLVKSGNTVAFSGLGSKMAKAMDEVGVLTEKDVTRYVGSKKLSQKAADTINLWRNGIPSDATLSEIREIADVLEGTMNNAERALYERSANRFAINKALPLDEAYDRLQYKRPEEYEEEEAERKKANTKVVTQAQIEALVKKSNGRYTKEQVIDDLKKSKNKNYVIEEAK